jgi:chromosome segregation ATPase
MSDTKAMSHTERLIYLITILVLLGIVAYMYYQSKNTQVQTNVLSQRTEQLKQELQQVNRLIKIKETEIDQVTHNKNVALKKTRQQLEQELKKLKQQRAIIQQNLREIGVLKEEKVNNTEKILQLNKELVNVKSRLQNVQKSVPQLIKNEVDSIKRLDSIKISQMRQQNDQLRLKVSKETKKQQELSNKLQELEKRRSLLASPLLRIEVFTDASKLRYSKLSRHIQLNFTILPNPIRKPENKLIKVYHLLYKYQDNKTQMKRRLITTIPYRKQKRLNKSVKYNNRKAFEKGTHVFEAEVDGMVLASKTVNVE